MYAFSAKEQADPSTTRQRKEVLGLQKNLQLQPTQTSTCVLPTGILISFTVTGTVSPGNAWWQLDLWILTFILNWDYTTKESGILSKSDLAHTFNLQINKLGLYAASLWQGRAHSLRQAVSLQFKSSYARSQKRARTVLVSTPKALELFTRF